MIENRNTYLPEQNTLKAYLTGNYIPQPDNLRVNMLSGMMGEYDYQSGGKIAGVVITQDENTPIARVLLFEESSGLKVAETYTDELGAFQFDNLNKGMSFFVIIKSPNPQWEHRVTSRRKPV